MVGEKIAFFFFVGTRKLRRLEKCWTKLTFLIGFLTVGLEVGSFGHLFLDFEIFDSISLEKILDVEISKREGGVIEDFSLSRLKKFE